ncbi:hypothetical protein M9414_01760 [Pasteurella multocida]|uniref:hypothetical protein n=1 Tax=Pasteurella multocida TaxID=747 RepID=UPI002025150B|nr:hypothetical protein [Pasteurella multocida]URK01770.1 hypothetical protein M9414_01760 [Pasteurella multocida]HDR1859256.1 hypothetical protein [Pasteurella multocida]HDR1894325.1 hypothetical protein [Pasteurella multocida]
MPTDNKSDLIESVFDKLHTQTKRAGLVSERVANMLNNDVDPAVIALQLTKNSKTGKTYTEEGVLAIAAVFDDCKQSTVMSKKQTVSLIKDQQQEQSSFSEESILA